MGDSTSNNYDIYRDSPLRLLGYANEVAEAFRPVVHKYLVYSGYGVAIGYVICDVIDKSYKAFATKPDGDVSQNKWILTAIDVGLWQSMASLVIPSIFINRFGAGVRLMMRKTTKIPGDKIKRVSVIASLLTIPLIVKPIDTSVDHLMDNYIRDHLQTEKKKQN